MEHRARILVGDDEHNLCRVLVARLAREGYLADEANDGVQVLQRLDGAAHDLVLLDLRMPILGGMDVLPEIRRRHPDTAIVVMTAYDDPHAVSAAMAAGADACLAKPFDLDRVAAAVAEVLARKRSASGAEEPPPPEPEFG